MSENECAANLMAELERELGVKGPANVLRAALKIAKEAAAEAKEVEPPAPPAWMVEVAREAAARRCEAMEGHRTADAYRSGLNDDLDAVQDSVAALRLALERGHVVEAREPSVYGAADSWRDAAARAERQRQYDEGQRTHARLAASGPDVPEG